MTIVLLVEGDTEVALKGHLKRFLDGRAAVAQKPRVRLETRQNVVNESPERIRGRVERELRRPGVVAVVALIDAYPRFSRREEPATAAKRYLREAVGENPRFHPHVALYDVEAWLLPYWDDIRSAVGGRLSRPGGNPEEVDGQNPPSHRLKQLYESAGKRYVKTIEMNRLLEGKDLTVAAGQCPEFRAFLNTLLELSGLEPI